MMMASRVFLEITWSLMPAMSGYTPEAGPPFPSTVVAGFLAALILQFLAENAASLVLAVPVFGAVFFPILPELRREGLGKQEKHDVVAPFGEVFFDDDAVFVLDEVPFAEGAGFVGEEDCEREEEAERRDELSTPLSSRDYHAQIEAA
jgi:hypothetical protein